MNKIFLTLIFGLMAFMLSAQYTFTVADCELTVLKDAVQHKVLNLHELEVRESSSTAFVLRDKINRVRFSANIFQCDDYATNALFLAFVDSVKLECNFPSSFSVVIENTFYSSGGMTIDALGTDKWTFAWNGGDEYDLANDAPIYVSNLDAAAAYASAIPVAYDSIRVVGTWFCNADMDDDIIFELFEVDTSGVSYDFGVRPAFGANFFEFTKRAGQTYSGELGAYYEIDFTYVGIVPENSRWMIGVLNDSGAVVPEIRYNLQLIGYKTL